MIWRISDLTFGRAPPDAAHLKTRSQGVVCRTSRAEPETAREQRRANLALEIATRDGRVLNLSAERVPDIESLLHGALSAKASAIPDEPPADAKQGAKPEANGSTEVPPRP
jgi:hypothetical protein